MFLDSIELTNFRNYEKLKLSLNENINIFYGNNGQGKTNILESIYFLALTKSHRTSNDYEMLLDKKKSFKVSTSYKLNGLKKNVSIKYVDRKKHLFIDNNEISKTNEYLSNINVLLFSPDDIEIIKGLPDIRRKFLNSELSQLYPIYFNVLTEFNKLLKMRNDLLKKMYYREKVDMNYFSILNEYFLEKSVFIYRARNRFINKLNNYAPVIFKDISKLDGFNIKYVPKIEFESYEEEYLKNKISDEMLKVFDDEVRVGMSLIGPHRDDFEFYLNDKNLKKYGSQGQQKLSVLSLKLAELKLFENQMNLKPILLLDDVFSEFDKLKKNGILKYINNDIQTIITTTDLNNISKDIIKKSKVYYVNNGVVQEK